VNEPYGSDFGVRYDIDDGMAYRNGGVTASVNDVDAADDVTDKGMDVGKTAS